MVTDQFKYFAKFPPNDAVLKLFDDNSLNDAGYTELLDYVNTLSNPVLPDVSAYIFTQDENMIRTIVEKTDGYIMMVEFGPVNGSGRDKIGLRDVDFNFSVIIARHFKQRKYDPVTETIIMDKCLDMIQSVIDTMQIDDEADEACPFLKLIAGSFDIAPLDPAGGLFGLYESIGYVLSFKETTNQFV